MSLFAVDFQIRFSSFHYLFLVWAKSDFTDYIRGTESGCFTAELHDVTHQEYFDKDDARGFMKQGLKF